MHLKSVFSTRSVSRSRAGIQLHAASAVFVLLCTAMLSVALLFASCANAVNSHGGPIDEGGGSSGGSGSSGASSGNNTTRNGRGGALATAPQAASRTVA